MGQPSLPPLPPSPLPPPAIIGGSVGCKVRCAGCKLVLTVPPGLIEFSCPTPTCQLPQMLPPEFMPANQTQTLALPPPPAPVQQHRNAPPHGIDPTKIQLPCYECKAVLNVPHGMSKFNCPQCLSTQSVNMSKLGPVFRPVQPPVFRQVPPPAFSSVPPPVMPTFNYPPPPPPPEEENEVLVC